MTIEEAVKKLKKEHENALSLDFVKDPVVYVLYKVWKEASDKKIKKERINKNGNCKT